MSELSDNLQEEFQDEDYRYAYDEEFSNARMATQIKVLREQQILRQLDLAELAGMRQQRICELENVNYNSWSISTLRRLARALGVRLSFGFESWGELLLEIESFSRKTLTRPKFEDDPAFKVRPVRRRSATRSTTELDIRPQQQQFTFAPGASRTNPEQVINPTISSTQPRVVFLVDWQLRKAKHRRRTLRRKIFQRKERAHG